MQIFSDEVSLVFLHGFLGSYHDFDKVIKALPVELQSRSHSISLPGHQNNEPANYYDSVNYIKSKLKELGISGDYVLYGYATGGRMAIFYSFLTKDPHIKGLFIESASFGITDEERKIREGRDLMWASQFALKPPETILRNWYNQPRFNGMTEQQKETIIKKRRHQDFKKLAVQFDLTSVARMENFRDRLNELPFPVIYIYGQLDEKFREAAERENSFSNFIPYQIPMASHNVHYFFPNEVAKIISSYANSDSAT